MTREEILTLQKGRGEGERDVRRWRGEGRETQGEGDGGGGGRLLSWCVSEEVFWREAASLGGPERGEDVRGGGVGRGGASSRRSDSGWATDRESQRRDRQTPGPN